MPAVHVASLEVSVPDRKSTLLPEVDIFVAGRLSELHTIDDDRRTTLGLLSAFVTTKVADGQPARLTFICTHNSRRSQLSQFWAQAAAHHFSVPGVEAFSGGTETTAFNLRAVAALRRAGFAIELFTDGKNPAYEVRYEAQMEPMYAFSKAYDEPPNPTKDFTAIMTCSAADAACPVVAGADERIAIPYDDPKTFEGTEREAEAYDERCAQIAREMLYVFSKVARRT